MEDEPRVGRKALLFALLGVFFAVFAPILGTLIWLVLALAWVILVLVWVLTAAQVRRPLVYILAFTVGFLAMLFLLGRLGISIVSG